MARPLGSGRTTLYYTLLWDSSTQPDAASRQKQVETYHLLFEKILRNMKKLPKAVFDFDRKSAHLFVNAC